MSEPLDHEMMLRDAKRNAGKPLQDFERFLIFMGIATPKVFLSTFSDNERLIDFFTKITGWERQRVQAAFDECVIKGYVDRADLRK